MEYLFEFIMELIIELFLDGGMEASKSSEIPEGGMKASKSSKIPKYVRYPLIVIIILFFVAVIGLIFLAGIMALKENVIGGIFLILTGVLVLIMSAIKVRKTYLSRMNKS